MNTYEKQQLYDEINHYTDNWNVGPCKLFREFLDAPLLVKTSTALLPLNDGFLMERSLQQTNFNNYLPCIAFIPACFVRIVGIHISICLQGISSRC